MSSPICAIATGPGGAIGIVRVSGTGCIALVAPLFRTRCGRPLTEAAPSRALLGDITEADGTVIDQALATVFRAPHSYTGEDSVELSCHASPYILSRVVQRLVEAGCRMAEPGEYTRRAYLNGKMDLSQAEAVADLIAAHSAAAHHAALAQMRGDVSRSLGKLREQLLHLTTLMELELDFSDHEELEFADRTELSTLAQDIEESVSRLAGTFSAGDAMRRGVPCCIVGAANAGKSSLLNALCGDDRAIVSDTAGTTRDTVEDVVDIDGTEFRFIDTAGLRATADRVEQMGIERSRDRMARANIIVWVADATRWQQELADPGAEILAAASGKQLVVVLNKYDLTGLPEAARDHFARQCADMLPDAQTHNAPAAPAAQPPRPTSCSLLSISTHTHTHISELRTRLAALAPKPGSREQPVITSLRHYEALTRALDDIRRVRVALREGLPTDLACEDLRLCLQHLADITGGEITPQETLNNVFAHFCVGK